MKLYLAVATLMLVLIAHSGKKQKCTHLHFSVYSFWLHFLVAFAELLFYSSYTEAVEEPTIEQHFANFQAKLQEFGDGLAEKTTNALKKIEESELVIKSK